MGIFKKLFDPKKENTDSYSSEITKRIEGFSEAVETSIHRSFDGMRFTFRCECAPGSTPPFIERIDQALHILPDHSNALFAKSEAHFAILDEKTGRLYQDKTLAINPNHFDAKMRQKHPEWTNMFAYPGWDEKAQRMPEVSLSVQTSLNNVLQIVREGLRLISAIFVPIAANDLPGKIVWAKWQPIWVKAEGGVAFFHYVIFKVEEYDKPACLEFMVNPYPYHPPLSLNGYWLLQRLCLEDYVWIVFNDGEKVLFNRKFDLTDSLKSDLKKTMKALSSLKSDEDSLSLFSSAVRFHQQNYDLDKLTKV